MCGIRKNVSVSANPRRFKEFARSVSSLTTEVANVCAARDLARIETRCEILVIVTANAHDSIVLAEWSTIPKLVIALSEVGHLKRSVDQGGCKPCVT